MSSNESDNSDRSGRCNHVASFVAGFSNFEYLRMVKDTMINSEVVAKHKIRRTFQGCGLRLHNTISIDTTIVESSAQSLDATYLFEGYE